MNIIRTGRNITVIALLLSLLFHASSMIYIFFTTPRNNLFVPSELNRAHDEQAQHEQKKEDPWVETKARADNFGAPVFFEDIAEDTAQEDNTLEGATEPHHTPQEEQTRENNTADTPPISPKKEMPVSHQEEKKVVNTTVAPISTMKKQTESKTGPHKSVTAQSQATRSRTIQKKASPPQSKPQPPLTLAQLTQGFLQQRKEDSGSYGISMLGMKQGIPSDEQMKYERYLQKLSWCVQNCFNIHRDRSPRISADTEMRIFFSLNRDGVVQQLTIKKSSGSKIIDDFVIFIFREASVSFPPVPGYLPGDPFQMNWLIPIKIMTY